jgi:allantoinase
MMPFDLLICSGTVVTSDGSYPLDIAIENGQVVEIAKEIHGSSRETIDATGLHIFPGLIDVHVHFNEPGRTEWEGFATGSAALAAGGGTCFFEMPLNAHPPTLDGASFDLKRAAAEASSCTDFALWGGLTPDNLDRLEELAERGVVGFKAFMSSSGIDDFGRADDLTLLRGMEIAAKLRLPVAVHAESEELTSQLTAEARSASKTGIRDYLHSRPAIAEVDAIRRAIAFARETGCSLHIVHVSTAAGVREVLDARNHLDGHGKAEITAETCPHYLLLNEEDVERIGPRAKCAPPIRDAAEVARMWHHITHGGIDLVASDHSPAPESMKSSADFFDVWGGIAGVQSTLAALLSRDPPLPLQNVAKLTATTPAQRFGIHGKGDIEVGFDADLALVDLGKSFTLSRDMLLDRHKLSPYVGRTFRGVVKRTIVRGQTVMIDGKATGQFRGKLIKPTREEFKTNEAAYGN